MRIKNNGLSYSYSTLFNLAAAVSLLFLLTGCYRSAAVNSDSEDTENDPTDGYVTDNGDDKSSQKDDPPDTNPNDADWPAIDILWLNEGSRADSTVRKWEQDAFAALIATLDSKVQDNLSIRMAVINDDMGVALTPESDLGDENILDNSWWNCAQNGADGQLLPASVISGCDADDDSNTALAEELSNGLEYIGTGNTTTANMNLAQFTWAGGCLIDGESEYGKCIYPQPLAALRTAVSNNPKTAFLRPDALTLVVMVSSSEDCTRAGYNWYERDEVQYVEMSHIACIREQNHLQDVSWLRKNIISIRSEQIGEDATSKIFFTVITGVPSVDLCQGFGEEVAFRKCRNVSPGINGEGTIEHPDEVTVVTPSGGAMLYPEFACQSFADGADTETDDPSLTAFPAYRLLDFTRRCGEMGYLYSICNKDWANGMPQVSDRISEILNASK